MTTQASPAAIDRLWRWFEHHAHELASGETSLLALIPELEHHLAEVGLPNWEIGPDDGGGAFFALSPGGKRDVLPETQRVVRQAPQLAGWRFLAAKPPRSWDLRFSVKTDDGDLDVDGQQWEFVLYRLRSGDFAVAFRPPPQPALSDDDGYCAAVILVDGELGEGTRLALIHDIELVTNWGPNDLRVVRLLEPGLLARVLRAQHH